MTSDLSSFDEAAERYQIERLKYAYMRCLDTKLWDEMRTLFAPDAVGEWSGGKLHYEGVDAIMAFLTESMSSERFLSSHRVHHPEIDFISPTEAKGVWALEDTVVMEEWNLLLQGAAFYEDAYRKVDGRWLFARTGYRRTFEYVIPTTTIPGFRLTASLWGTDGQSQLV